MIYNFTMYTYVYWCANVLLKLQVCGVIYLYMYVFIYLLNYSCNNIILYIIVLNI